MNVTPMNMGVDAPSRRLVCKGYVIEYALEKRSSNQWMASGVVIDPEAPTSRRRPRRILVGYGRSPEKAEEHLAARLAALTIARTERAPVPNLGSQVIPPTDMSPELY